MSVLYFCQIKSLILKADDFVNDDRLNKNAFKFYITCFIWFIILMLT